jgi:hypothetical protein
MPRLCSARHLAATLAALLVTLAAGCGSETGEQRQPTADTADAGPQDVADTSSPEPDTGPDPLSDTEACEESVDYVPDERASNLEGETYCDGQDNDCDGTKDEGCLCTFGDSDQGVCSGTQRFGEDGDCKAPANWEPEESSCDGKDNDCDGNVDEGITRSCTDGGPCDTCQGVCSGATESCVEGGSGEWTCQMPDAYQPDGESTCENGRDDDCDGDADREDTDCRRPALADCTDDSQCIPSGKCIGGTCAQTIAITNTSYSGDVSGARMVDRIDDICTEVYGLTNPGEWKAVASTPEGTARERLEFGGAIFNAQGERVADSPQALWDPSTRLQNSIGFGDSQRVWTGTTAEGGTAPCGNGSDGSGQCNCANWDSDTLSGRYGMSGEIDSGWIDSGSFQCSRAMEVYCIDGQ